MSMSREIRLRLGNVVGPFFGCLLVGYFAYHIIEGERGLPAWQHLSDEVVKAEMTLAALKEERMKLERRVSLLRPDGLDLDLLEERARVMLDLGHPSDMLIVSTSDPH